MELYIQLPTFADKQLGYLNDEQLQIEEKLKNKIRY